MKITDILSKDSVICDATASSKKQTLEMLSRLASQKTGLNERTIFDALIERERLGTTGVGKGVALPHTRLAKLDRIYCAFMKTSPVDFEAVDGKVVDLIFLLLVPEEAGADHLKALARLSRILRDETVAADLRAQKTVDGLYQIICQSDTDDL